MKVWDLGSTSHSGNSDGSPPNIVKRHDAFSSFDDRVAALNRIWPMDQRTRRNLEKALALIDPTDRQAFLDRNRESIADIDTLASRKYADLAYWAHRNVLFAQWLELDRGRPPLDILDIGAGSGNFAMVARAMGHRVVGTDVDDSWYAELCQLTGIRPIIAPVRRGEHYKPVEKKFDLITIMLPVFHRQRVNGAREYWSVEDWRIFLSQLVEDLLKRNGSIFILMPLDKDEDGRLSYSPLVEWSRDRGARLGRTIEGSPIRHILFDPATPETFSVVPPANVAKCDVTLDDI